MSVTLQAIPALPEALSGPLGNLLIALVILALVVLVGRLVLNVAWRLLKLAGLVVGVVWLLSTIAPQTL